METKQIVKFEKVEFPNFTEYMKIIGQENKMKKLAAEHLKKERYKKRDVAHDEEDYETDYDNNKKWRKLLKADFKETIDTWLEGRKFQEMICSRAHRFFKEDDKKA